MPDNRKGFASALHIRGLRQRWMFSALLRRMADRGELLLTGKRYALPPQKKPLETN